MSTSTTKPDEARNASRALDASGGSETVANNTVSTEEVERAASRFTPAWDEWEASTDDEDATAEASTARSSSPTRDVSHSAEHAVAGSDKSLGDAREKSLPADIGEQGSDGPVDLVASIPKRTEIDLKDEPSVVVPDEAEEKRSPTVPPPAPRSPAHRPAVRARPIAHEDLLAQPGAAKGRATVIGVLALLALGLAAVGVRLAFRNDEPALAPVSVPAGTQAAVHAPQTQPIEPSPQLAAKPDRDKTPPAVVDLPVAAKTASTAPASPDAAATQPATKTQPAKTAPSKPPATKPSAQPTATKTDPPAKPPPGGIVRDAPF